MHARTCCDATLQLSDACTGKFSRAAHRRAKNRRKRVKRRKNANFGNSARGRYPIIFAVFFAATCGLKRRTRTSNAGRGYGKILASAARASTEAFDTGALTMPHMVVESGEVRKECIVKGGLSGEYSITECGAGAGHQKLAGGPHGCGSQGR